MGTRRVTAVQELEEPRDEEVPAPGLVAGLLDHPLATREPAAGLRHLTVQQQDDAQPEGAPHCTPGLLAVDPLAERPRPRLHAFAIPTDQVGRYRQALEVGSVRAPRAGELGVRVGPRPAGERRTPAFHGVGHARKCGPRRAGPKQSRVSQAARAAYPGLITSLISASRSSKPIKADFIALTVNQRRSSQS